MEIFKVIKEYPSYCISNKGTIKKIVTNRLLSPTKKANGYKQVNLCTEDGRRKKEYVHRLVAITFIPNPKHLPEVNHIDGIRDHNELSNLEWVSRQENIDKSSIRKPIKVFKNNTVMVFDSIQRACDELHLTGSNVSACLKGEKQKTHRGYTFKFVK